MLSGERICFRPSDHSHTNLIIVNETIQQNTTYGENKNSAFTISI